MKADLFFYSEFCGGELKIPAAEFSRWESCAEKELARITGGKSIESSDEAVKECICDIAEIMYQRENIGGVISENNDGYSVTYEKGDIKTAIYDAAKRHLFGTDLLYRGV